MLSCVGDGPIERDRDAEFAVAADLGRAAPALRRVPGTRRGAADGHVLRATSRAISRHPAGDRMNRRCLTHTVEHLGLHLGHVEVTIDWWKATQSS